MCEVYGTVYDQYGYLESKCNTSVEYNGANVSDTVNKEPKLWSKNYQFNYLHTRRTYAQKSSAGVLLCACFRDISIQEISCDNEFNAIQATERTKAIQATERTKAIQATERTKAIQVFVDTFGSKKMDELMLVWLLSALSRYTRTLN